MAAKKKKTQSKKKKSPTVFNLTPLLAALPDSAKLTDPPLPADVLIAEAKVCSKEALRHELLFAALQDFDRRCVVQLPHLIASFESAQRAWDQARMVRSAGKNRAATRQQADQLRTELVASARYLLRRNPGAQLELDRITQGDGLPDLVADLRDLALLGKQHAAVFAKAPGFPKDAFTQCTQLADALEETTDAEPALQAREHRNRVGAVLDQWLTEVRDAARYVFRKDPARLRPFLSSYIARKMARSRKNAANKPQ